LKEQSTLNFLKDFSYFKDNIVHFVPENAAQFDWKPKNMHFEYLRGLNHQPDSSFAEIVRKNKNLCFTSYQ